MALTTTNGQTIMNTSKLADYDEVIGSIAVVLALLFVGMQVSEGNRETRTATTQASLQSEMDMMRTLILHAGTWEKVVAGEPLTSGEETRRGIVLFNLLMTDYEHTYFLFKSGYLESGQWEGRLASLPPLVRLPIFEIWIQTIGALAHSDEFLDQLNTQRGETSDN